MSEIYMSADGTFKRLFLSMVIKIYLSLPAITDLIPDSWLCYPQSRQDCFLQNEAKVCVSKACVIEDSKFKLCLFVFVLEDEQMTKEAHVPMWILGLSGKASLAEGTVVWND